MDEHNGPDRRLEERLRRGMRPGGLSPAQRQRHLDRINARGAWEMDFVRQRSFAELGVVVAVLLVVTAIGLWQIGVLDSDEDGNIAAEPTALANTGVTPAATATLAAADVSPTRTAAGSGSSCDVTPFSDTRPENYPDDPVHENWFEGQNLWTSPPDINAINPSLPATDNYWFTGVLPVMWFVEAVDIPVVSATHLTEPDATFSYEFQQPYEHWRAHSLLEFSEPGCWEVQATTSDGEIAFTIDVLPLVDRPDAIYQFEQWQASSPYGVPGSCQTTNWSLEDRVGSMFALFWMDGDGISANSETGLFFASRDNEVMWAASDGNTEIDVTGHLLDDPSVELEVTSEFETVTNAARYNRQVATWIDFPEAGCWSIQAESPSGRAEFIIFVYP